MEDISAVKPSSLGHFVGNEGVKKQVQVLLDACHQDAIRFPHAALLGGPGLGKTTLAGIIAQEMGVNFHEALGQSLKKPSDLTTLLLQAGPRDVVHLDEVHEAPKEVMTALYRCIDDRKLFVPGNGPIQSIPLNDFTLLVSTTDEWRLLSPLLSRTRQLHLEFYGDGDLERIVSMRADGLCWKIDPSILPLIASRSRRTARKALAILTSCRRVCRADGESIITVSHLDKASELEGLDRYGLERRDRQFLRLLNKGPTKVNVLASKLGLPVKTLTTHLEPPLLMLGFLEKDEQGRRVLTAKARKHLKEFGDE